MKKQTHENDMNSLAEDARALMAATADVAGDKVADARKRLAGALEGIKDKAAGYAKNAHEMIQERPYHAIGIAFGVGAFLGCLVAYRFSRNDE
jgi:ElaB/YqjD/DUF883 family membrane-anchored ribosome-binding protein